MVKGVTAFHARLVAVPDKIRKAVVPVMEAQANKIVAEMKRLVPVDKGALRDSIGWTWGSAPKGSVAVGSVGQSPKAALRITIYAGTRDKSLGDADTFYAVFQEYGREGMLPTPFFWPAWRRGRSGVRAAISRAVRKALAEA